MGILDLYINPPKIKLPKYVKARPDYVKLSLEEKRLSKFWDRFGGKKISGAGIEKVKKIKALNEMMAYYFRNRLGNPLKNGGTNPQKNIISLCESCHTDIHPWLTVRWLDQEVARQDLHLRSIRGI